MSRLRSSGGCAPLITSHSMRATSPRQSRLRTEEHRIFILRYEEARDAQDHVGHTVDSQPHAQKSRQEPRPVHEQRQRQEPESPEHLGGSILLVAQAEKQQGERIPLRLVEDGQKRGSAHERQGRAVAHDADEVDDCRHYAAENHDQHCEVVVHPLEQPVEGEDEEDQDDRAHQVAEHPETKEPLVSGDVAGRRRRVPAHEQLGGDVNEAERAAEDQEQIPEPGHSPWIAGRRHLASLRDSTTLAASEESTFGHDLPSKRGDGSLDRNNRSGCALRRPSPSQDARVRRGRGPDARTRHRREHGGVQRDEQRPAGVAPREESAATRLPENQRLPRRADRLRRHVHADAGVRSAAKRRPHFRRPDGVGAALHLGVGPGASRQRTGRVEGRHGERKLLHGPRRAGHRRPHVLDGR